MSSPLAPTSSAPAVTSVSDLIFSSSQANHQFNRILTDLKKSNLSIHNRLRSIQSDSEFVTQVAAAFNDRPLVANERCGSWYIPPSVKAGSAYFKSTDGHFGVWSFSTRRLNLQLLELIGRRDGCVVVDSTRRGKRMPDALSKTVPIWCCVLNHVLFPRQEAYKLYTPPNAVSESEHAQMWARIPEHIEALKRLGLDFDSYKTLLKKPLRPIWVTQESHLADTEEVFEEYHPVICCTSSKTVVGGEMSEGGYIQGAGDDTENWAFGLTPPVFWENAELLFSTPETELPDLVHSLVATHAASKMASAPKQIAPGIFVTSLPLGQPPSATACTISLQPGMADPNTWTKSPSHMEVGIGKHKLASRNLRTALPQILDFVRKYLEQPSSPADGVAANGGEEIDTEKPSSLPGDKHILIACESGRDISVGVALAVLCQHFDDDRGQFHPRSSPDGINKNIIKVKLGRVMTALPEANPSRATLQSVNSYLMG